MPWAHLQWEHHQGNTNENDHEQLGGPDLGRDVPIANRGEGDDTEIKGVKPGKLFSSSFQMLDATSSVEELYKVIKALLHLSVTIETLYVRNLPHRL